MDATKELDEADALIAELLGLMGHYDLHSYPAGSSKQIALHNWQRRCVERAGKE